CSATTRRADARRRRSEGTWKVAAWRVEAGGSNPSPKAQTGVSPSGQESPSIGNPHDGDSGSHPGGPTNSPGPGTFLERAKCLHVKVTRNCAPRTCSLRLVRTSSRLPPRPASASGEPTPDTVALLLGEAPLEVGFDAGYV